jgi:hypothetical protein
MGSMARGRTAFSMPRIIDDQSEIIPDSRLIALIHKLQTVLISL